MNKIEKQHWERLESQLGKWNFEDNGNFLTITHNYPWSRPEEKDTEDLLHSMYLSFDKQGKFFSIEMTNEHGHHADNPLPHIKSAVDVIDLWKSLTGKILIL